MTLYRFTIKKGDDILRVFRCLAERRDEIRAEAQEIAEVLGAIVEETQEEVQEEL